MSPLPPHASPLVHECRDRSLDLLRRNSTPLGMLAATPSERADRRHYLSIFGRDAAICAIAMAADGDPHLVATARAGLVTLGRHQAGNGQIPKFVKPLSGEVDFWYTGCLDATLWWLLAVRLFDRLGGTPPLGQELRAAVRAGLAWLHGQEHPEWRLLQQNEASDWADIMPRSGFVLYSNALWFWLKKMYGLPGAGITRNFANLLLQPFVPATSSHRRARLLAHYIRKHARADGLYLSFVNFSFWGEEGDVLGNILAVLAGLADPSLGRQIQAILAARGVAHPRPVRTVVTPLQPTSPQWRRYMQRHRQNLPYQYHNGGAWPFLGGFWVLLLQRLGQAQQAVHALEQLALANAAKEWQFNEWFHGQTGEPLGMPGQSWNAALYLLAHGAVFEDFNLFD